MDVVEEIPRRISKGDEEEEEDVVVKRRSNANANATTVVGGGIDFGRLCGWPSSRIVRVSRASGGKDRHSKVLTSRGLRDRRVRLSVNTAIQFYDLQDRLGVDQPSKAVEWLLKAAASSISELPCINMTSSFLETPNKQLSSNGKRSSEGFETDSADVEIDGTFDPKYQVQQQQQQQTMLSKSTCSSTSETSKGLRSESRVKARERARGRAAAGKEKENNHVQQLQHQPGENLNTISQNGSSFTELLTCGMNMSNNVSGNGNDNNHSRGGAGGGGGDGRNWCSSPMDYFATGLLGPASTRTTNGFSGQIHFGEQYQEVQPFSFAPEPFVNGNNNNNNAYDLNFTISSSSTSGLAGFNRGTLQSNSTTPSLLPQIQRYSTIDGSTPNFLIGSNAPVENHHHHHHILPGFDARLQLYYGDGRHSDHHKGKEKN